MQTYGRLPVTFTSGEGAWLTDNNGERYLDALSGIAVCNLGHAHPRVTKAIQAQASILVHTSNLYHIERQSECAEKLCSVSGMQRVFFGNSGAEANEAMIKIARLYGNNRGINNPTILVMDNAFHGRTMATLTATGNVKAQLGFEPLLGGFQRVPYNDVEAIEQAVADNDSIVAVMLEPVQGEGGINIPADDYLAKVRALCDQNELLMLVDEIQTGIGRSGEWFAYQHAGILPDVVSSAKGLGNGMPIGACLAQGTAAEIFAPGHHGSTFGGNPLACAAASAVLDEIAEQDLLVRTRELADQLHAGFTARLGTHSQVVDIRNKGLLIGIELAHDCAEVVSMALDNKCLLNVTAGNVVRLLPPLTLSKDEANELVARVADTIEAFLDKAA